MPNKRPTPEQIIGKLYEVEIVLAQGISIAKACHRIAVSVQTYYRWCRPPALARLQSETVSAFWRRHNVV